MIVMSGSAVNTQYQDFAPQEKLRICFPNGYFTDVTVVDVGELQRATGWHASRVSWWWTSVRHHGAVDTGETRWTTA